jgi:O-antigen ligase
MPRNATNVTLLVLGITATIALAGPPVVKEFTSSFASDEERDSSAESRFYLWEAGAKIIAAHPLVGVGPGASRYYVPQYYRMESGLTIKALHNVIFEVGAETGIFGLISYITFFFAPLIYVVKNRLYFASAGSKYWLPALAVIAGVPGYFLASMFSSGSLIESSYTLPIIGCVLIRILEAGELDEVPSDDSEPSITPEIAIV